MSPDDAKSDTDEGRGTIAAFLGGTGAFGLLIVFCIFKTLDVALSLFGALPIFLPTSAFPYHYKGDPLPDHAKWQEA